MSCRAEALPHRRGPVMMPVLMSTTYTAKDITVLEGLEPVRKRPGMYIGGVGASGLHHLVWETLDNAVDEAMNGHATTIAVTLHADGSSLTVADDGRGIPVDRHPEDEAERAGGDLHGAPRRREVRGRQLQDGRRPARRGRVGRQRALEGAGRHRQARRLHLGDAFQAGEADRSSQEPWSRARQRHDGLLPSRPDDLPEGGVRSRPHPRAARGDQLHPQGCEGHVRERGDEREGGLPARGGARCSISRRSSGSAAPSRCTRRRSRWSGPTGCAWMSCCSGPSRPTSTFAATRMASRPDPAARTRTACARAWARRCGTSSRRTTCRRRA